MNNIAFNIKTLRTEKGLSQEQFAQALHVTRQTVSSWERGMSRPGLESLQQMADVLGVEVEQLLYGPENAKKPLYRPVSFWPVAAIIPTYLFLLILFAYLFYFIGFGVDGYIAGQLALAVIIMCCYCLLKDEIRNRDYYNKTEAHEEPSEKNGL